MSSIRNTVIGIDLGTSYSRVAVWQNGKVEIIPNENGSRTTPSCVAFTNSERLIGEAAENQITLNPTNTIFHSKRVMGCKFNDQKLQKNMDFWPFVVLDRGGYPKFLVDFKGETRRYTPEEINSMVLTKMKEIAEAYLGSTVKDAVITVPSFFNQAQRQATLDAGAIAGLNVLRVINEATAAALAYELNKNFIDVEDKKNVLIFSMGGGNTSVSVIAIENGASFEVKSTAGDSNLSGEDFDNRLMSYFMDELKLKHEGKVFNWHCGKRRLRLKTACEKAKRTLSCNTDATIAIDNLYQEINFYTRISRARFEDLCIDLFTSALKLVEKAVSDSKLSKAEIHEVVLVGGSTRIPKIQKLLQEYFNGKQFNKTVNADEAPVYGAAVQAAILSADSRRTNKAVPKITISDVIPYSLGFENLGGYKYQICERNAKIPCTTLLCFTTTEDNQTHMGFWLFDGDISTSAPAEPAHQKLGSFTLGRFPSTCKGETMIAAKYEVDANGILLISWKRNDTEQYKGVAIKYNVSSLTGEQIQRMFKDAAKDKAEDDQHRQNIMTRNKLESYIVDAKQASAMANQKCADVLAWLDNHKGASTQELELKRGEFHRDLQPFVAKIRLNDQRPQVAAAKTKTHQETNEELENKKRSKLEIPEKS